MKKTIALLGLGILLSFTTDLSAQMYVGGSVSLDQYNDEDKSLDIENTNINKQTQFSVSPNVGYFLSKNFLLGVGFNYYRYKRTYEYNSGSGNSNNLNNRNTFTVEPFIRHYISISERIRFTNHFGVFIGTVNGNSTYRYNGNNFEEISDDKGTILGFNYNPGLSINITDKILFEIGFGNLSYNMENSESTSEIKYDDGTVDDGSKNENKSSNFNFRYNQFSFGLAYKF
ncbi:MAG: outer membrane beta-barrel protein [Salinivirgaceae bacterium]|jgi:hypothetical protein|nr:outer membrane beta-barrel protein [Salinivirgaceae bacterium]